MSVSRDPADGPLAGLRVVDASTLFAGPMAAMHLGDLGADVVKVEHPRRPAPSRGHGAARDGVNLWWKTLGRNKRAITADLSSPGGRDVLLALAATADVVIENFRPGTLERWGLGYEQLAERNPGLVLARVSGFGQVGPYRGRPGFGTLAEAMSGFAAMTGEPDGPPTLPPFGLGDGIASLATAFAVMVALRSRDHHPEGRGQVVDVALTEAVFSMLEGILPEYGYLGAIRERIGNTAHNSAPTNAYRCADGGLVCIAANTTRLFRNLFRVIGRDDVGDDRELWTNQGRVRRADELDEVIGSWTRTRTADEVVALLRERQIPVSRINSIADIAADPQFRARDMLVAVDDDRLDKPLLVPGVAPKLSRTPGRVPPLGRALGADTDAIRQRIDRVRADGDAATLRTTGTDGVLEGIGLSGE